MQEIEENNTKTIHRLGEYITKSGLSFNKLATELGLSNSYFSKMVKNNGSIGSDILEKILRIYPNVNPTWLLTGKGSMLHEEEQPFYISVPNDSSVYQLYKEMEAKADRLLKENADLKNEIRRLEADRVDEKFAPSASTASKSKKGSGASSQPSARSDKSETKSKGL